MTVIMAGMSRMIETITKITEKMTRMAEIAFWMTEND